MPKTKRTLATTFEARTTTQLTQLLHLINASKDPVGFVSFSKKSDGSTRNMVFCMPGRAEVAESGQPVPYSRMLNDIHSHTLTVWDINKDNKSGGKGDYRRINIKDIYSLYIDGEEYTIEY